MDMTDDHPQRITAVEIKVDHLDERMRRIESTQDTHTALLSSINKHIAEQTGALRLGKWVIGGVGTFLLIVLGSLAKRMFE